MPLPFLLSLPFHPFLLGGPLCVSVVGQRLLGDSPLWDKCRLHQPQGWAGVQRSWPRFQTGSIQERWTPEWHILLWYYCWCRFLVTPTGTWWTITQHTRPSQGLAGWKAKIRKDCNVSALVNAKPQWCTSHTQDERTIQTEFYCAFQVNQLLWEC